MKKLFLILMPIALLMSIFGFLQNKNLNFMFALNGLKNTQFADLDMASVKVAFDRLDITSSWGSIHNPLDVAKATFNSITTIGESMMNRI